MNDKPLSVWLLDVARTFDGFLHPQCVMDESTHNRGVSVEGNIELDGKKARLRIELEESFPNTPPRFFLTPPMAFGRLPHVQPPHGYICSLPKEGLLLDRYNPEGVLREGYKRAILLLQQGCSGQNKWDFLNEFEAHWPQIIEETIIASEPPFLRPFLDSYIIPSKQPKQIRLAYNKENKYVAFFDERDTTSQFTERVSTNFESQDAIYVPLCSKAFFDLPHPERAWSLQEVRELVHSHTTKETLPALEEMITWKPRKHEAILFGMPRPSGGHVLFGLLLSHTIENRAQEHPLFSHDELNILINPFIVVRFDKDFILPRGGGIEELQQKSVIIIGCGSVGGHIASTLATSGIGRLTLIDHEIIESANIYRHNSGAVGVGLPKVYILKAELEAKVPFVKITPVAEMIQSIVETRFEFLKESSLVVVALGDPNLEFIINERFQQTKNSPPVLFTWLEPFGIGGHALLTNNGAGGCLQCLYTASANDETWQLCNRAAFAAPGQDFTRSLTGCGRFYTPYSNIHAIKTATLASELATSYMQGYQHYNPLISWKGDATLLKKNGFTVSYRYQLTKEQLFEGCFGYINPVCPVCKGGHH